MGDDPHHVCHFYTTEEMGALTDDELKAKSFHHVIRPCYGDLDFGKSTQCVNGALLPEKTHVVNLVTTKETGDIYPTHLSTASINHTNEVLSYMIGHTQLPSDLKFPIISPFQGGLEKVRKLKAKE
jgi:hypothetical protein